MLLALLVWLCVVWYTHNFLVASVVSFVFWDTYKKRVKETYTQTKEIYTQTPIRVRHKHSRGDVFINKDFSINIFASHAVIFCVTRYGKTSLLNTILLAIHTKMSVEEVKVCIIDLKAVSFTLINNSPYLWNTLYVDDDGIKAVTAELFRRKELFVNLSNKKSKTITTIKTYNSVSNDKMPQLVVIIDEVFMLSQEAKESLAIIIRLGLAFGISVIITSQRGTKETLPQSTISQFSLRIIGVLDNRKEYGYAGVEKHAADKLLSNPTPGMFAVRQNQRWTVIKTDYVSGDELDDLLNSYKPALTGTSVEKNQQVLDWFNTLNRKPTIATMQNKWGITKHESRKYLALWKQRN